MSDRLETPQSDGLETCPTTMTMSLDSIPIGGSARVAAVNGFDATSLRLLEMGLTPGVAVRVLGTAPLGCPVELEVRGYHLSIRRSEAARIAVSA